MACVYKYIDKLDGIVKYVGIVYGESRTLRQRVCEHAKFDSWVGESEWDIWFLNVPVDNRTDAEYLEAHYISLYHTDKYYNKAKAGWGISKYIPDRESDWVRFDIVTDVLKTTKAGDFLTIYFNTAPEGREELFNKTFRPNGRMNGRLLAEVNKLINNLCGIENYEDFDTDQGYIDMGWDGIIKITTPRNFGKRKVFNVGYDGVVYCDKFSSADFISDMAQYINNLSVQLKQLESAMGKLKELHYFNAA